MLTDRRELKKKTFGDQQVWALSDTQHNQVLAYDKNLQVLQALALSFSNSQLNRVNLGFEDWSNFGRGYLFVTNRININLLCKFELRDTSSLEDLVINLASEKLKLLNIAYLRYMAKISSDMFLENATANIIKYALEGDHPALERYATDIGLPLQAAKQELQVIIDGKITTHLLALAYWQNIVAKVTAAEYVDDVNLIQQQDFS